MVYTSTITINSSDATPELINITDFVRERVELSLIKNGQVTVFSQHTTAAVILQENEPGIHQDIKTLLERLSPTTQDYHHSLAPDHVEDKMPNGHSHLQHFLVGGASQTIPLHDGNLLLGTYQSVFLVELDRSRVRNVIVNIIGE